MNHKPAHPNAATREFEGPEKERLGELERRLRATRPRAVQLDLVALQQIADREATVELPATRSPGRVLVIAGSWGCGVAVGALVMYVLMNLATSAESAGGHVVRTERQSPGVLPDTVTLPATETGADLPGESSVAVSATSQLPKLPELPETLNALSANATYAADGPTLRVGTHLQRTARYSTWPAGLALTEERAAVKRLEPAATRTKASFEGEPELPVSRREMMREILQEQSASVL